MRNGFWVFLEITGVVVAVSALAIAAWVEPDPSGYGTHTQLGLAPCGYFVATGKPCVSCGLTTAYAEMIRFRPVAAFHANPAGVVLFLLTVATPAWLLHALVTGQDPLRFTQHRFGRWVLPAVAVVLIASWAVRTL